MVGAPRHLHKRGQFSGSRPEQTSLDPPSSTGLILWYGSLSLEDGRNGFRRGRRDCCQVAAGGCAEHQGESVADVIGYVESLNARLLDELPYATATPASRTIALSAASLNGRPLRPSP